MTSAGSNPDAAQRSDAELARAARAGSIAAFDQLVIRHHAAVFAFLVSLTRHRQDAEDVTQETFLKAWKNIRRYDPARPLRPWLMTIARRESIAALRRKRPLPALTPTGDQHDPWQAAPADSQGRRLWALASSHLSPDACAALWLHYREELPLDQVGRILGKRTGAVKTMLHRARNTLAAAARHTSPPPSPPPPLPSTTRNNPPPLPPQWTIQPSS